MLMASDSTVFRNGSIITRIDTMCSTAGVSNLRLSSTVDLLPYPAPTLSVSDLEQYTISSFQSYTLFQPKQTHSETTNNLKFTLPILFALLTGALAKVVPIPFGIAGAVATIGNDLRIYVQGNDTAGIKEISVGIPNDPITANKIIFDGPMRQYTPLAAVSWFQDKHNQIRVYYITPTNTIGEVGYDGATGNWSNGDLQIPVLPFSNLLYATKVRNMLVVGYTSDHKGGLLNEAYVEVDVAGATWKTYELSRCMKDV
ncbi:uncharacterized protein EI97DRAFT_438467 [Westerdykella ornata]|uniref:Fucose-specific lectin n=1 Tax=Westerdykella ornata TaxID=318751 RepID=A0A6A6JXY6_WESOR|nr:uncharacterized protein EI97DRAFT_438467 [Westerdykella ornata]KAF2281064.1 hypothetical protein EI97DRAFT_438467 [Westerdykella ornata]